MKILLLSDLHAVLPDDKLGVSVSRLVLDSEGKGEYGDGLIQYVNSLNEQFDYIVCCGDIATRGCKETFKAGWIFLNRLQQSLHPAKLVCVPGNHDHQSRPPSDKKEDGFSPTHNLQFCDPPFPFSSFEKNTHFWAWHWYLDEEDKDCNILYLNTSAYHGYGDEYEHGRISTQAASQIKNHIGASNYQQKSINIVVCHHHPQPMEHAYQDYDGQQMSGGQNLLNTLQEANIGPWLILHGHKHFPCVSKALSQDETPPIVFSAASSSVKDTQPNKYPNQIYILNIYIDETEQEEKIIGKFETHEYQMVNGWAPAKSNSLPANGGFGGIKSTSDVIKIIKAALETTKILEGDELSEINEHLSFFIPKEFEKFKIRLDRHGIAAEIDIDSQKIIEIGEKNA